MRWALFLVAAYLLGSVSFSYLVVRWRQGRDIRGIGSGNAGATNVLRVEGRAAAALVLLADLAKGALPPLAALAWGAPPWVLAASAVAPTLGHVFPVLHGFRGGKGVATTGGAMFVLAPLPALVSLAVFLALAAGTRQVALASMVAVGLFPLLLLAAAGAGLGVPAPRWLLASAGALSALIIAKHWDNVVRIREGTEWKLGDSRDE